MKKLITFFLQAALIFALAACSLASAQTLNSETATESSIVSEAAATEVASPLTVIYSKEIDWEEVSQQDPHYLDIQGTQVPYVVFDNADDVTSQRGAALGERLEQTMNTLWELYKNW